MSFMNWVRRGGAVVAGGDPQVGSSHPKAEVSSHPAAVDAVTSTVLTV